MSHQPEQLLQCPFCNHHPDPNNLIDSLHPTGIYGHLINPQDVSEGVYFSRHSAGSVFDCWKFSCLESEGGCGASISGESKQNVIDKWNTRAIASVKREPQWLPIESAPKGRKLIVGYFNKLGNWRTIIARYYLPGTLAAHEDADESQCDEEGYAKEGWYEESETHEFIMPTDEAPTHYMLLTPAPVTATTASANLENE